MTLDDKIKHIHKGGLKGLFKVYSFTNTIKTIPFWAAIISTCLVMIFCLFFKNGTYKTLVYLIDLSKELIPNLLGFSLAGLTIIVTFSNSELIQKISKLDLSEEKLKPSLFQTTIGIFTWGLLFQAITFCFTLIFDMIKYLESGLLFSTPEILVRSVNFIGLVILVLSLSYSIFLIPQITVNLFTIGQLNHFEVNLIRLLKEAEEAKKTSKDVDDTTPAP